jgi:phosphonoacetaldehyde hydrolase
MPFMYRRSYRGTVRLVVTDLAGTTVDFGSCAPAGAFIKAFEAFGVTVTQEQARGPMGLHKRDHIRTLLELPAVSESWEAKHGAPWSEADLDRIFETFIPLQMACLPDFCDVIPGVPEAVAELHTQGVKVAATTGYNRDMLDIVLGGCAAGGFVPDFSTCATEVTAGRPAPWMIFRCMEHFGVYPPESVVKIGDTLPDVKTGLNAGVWTVGVAATGNMLGLDRAAYEALDEGERLQRVEDARELLFAAGAHYVTDSFAELPGLLDEIHLRLRRGEKP